MNENIELKPKSKSLIDKINELFENRNKRILYLLLFILPFLIAIGIFGFVTYKEAKNIISLISDEGETKEEYNIAGLNYKLRDNATDVQLEYFTELKNAVEGSGTDIEIAGLVGKNYVADFYTWTNKQGQFDVGGVQYFCSEKNEEFKYKENIYQKARDGFYKYLNQYINEYGSANLLEVASVEITKCAKRTEPYYSYELVDKYTLDQETWTTVYDYVEHDCYDVSLTWTYNPNTKLNLNDYATSINLFVINNDGRYEIVEASEKEIKIEQNEDTESETVEEDVTEDE